MKKGLTKKAFQKMLNEHVNLLWTNGERVKKYPAYHMYTRLDFLTFTNHFTNDIFYHAKRIKK